MWHRKGSEQHTEVYELVLGVHLLARECVPTIKGGTRQVMGDDAQRATEAAATLVGQVKRSAGKTDGSHLPAWGRARGKPEAVRAAIAGREENATDLLTLQ